MSNHALGEEDQIGKEMKEAVHSEADQAEVKAMNAEVHRMQVYLS